MRPSLKRAEVEGVLKEAVFFSRREECQARLKRQIQTDIRGRTENDIYWYRLLQSLGLAAVRSEQYTDATLVALAALPSE